MAVIPFKKAHGKKGWHAIVYLGTDQNGHQKRRKRNFSTEAAARQWEAKMYLEIKNGGIIPDGKITLGEWFEMWLEDTKARPQTTRPRMKTLATYEGYGRKHIIPALGHVKLSRLTPELVQLFLNALDGREYQTGKKRKTLTGTTALHIHRLLHKILKDAMRKGSLTRNVADANFVEPPKRTRKEPHIWDPEQVRLFLGTAKRAGNDFVSVRNYTIWLFAICTGCRSSETAGLTWDRVDLGLNLVRVERQLQRNYGKRIPAEDKVKLCDPKTDAGRRMIPLIPHLADALRSLKERQENLRRELGERYLDKGFVFTQPTGQPVHPDDLRSRAYRRTITAAKLPYVRPHDLRHTCGSFLKALGVDDATIAAILGHADKSFTLRTYVHEVAGMKEAAMKKLADALFGKGTDRGA